MKLFKYLIHTINILKTMKKIKKFFKSLVTVIGNLTTLIATLEIIVGNAKDINIELLLKQEKEIQDLYKVLNGLRGRITVYRNFFADSEAEDMRANFVNEFPANWPKL